jgi:hypothetical protein
MQHDAWIAGKQNVESRLVRTCGENVWSEHIRGISGSIMSESEGKIS